MYLFTILGGFSTLRNFALYIVIGLICHWFLIGTYIDVTSVVSWLTILGWPVALMFAVTGVIGIVIILGLIGIGIIAFFEKIAQ